MAMNLSDAFIGEPNHDGAAVVWCGCAVDQTNVDQRLNGLRYSAGRERNGLSQSFDAKPLGMNELKLMENLPGCRRDKAVNFSGLCRASRICSRAHPSLRRSSVKSGRSVQDMLIQNN